MTRRFNSCRDCTFEGVEPAICDECRDADQFQESNSDDAIASAPLYYHDWKDAQ